jgi:hypothetical protein
MKLVEIANLLHQVELAIIENNGELTEELQKELSPATIALEKKIDAYHAVLERCKSIQVEMRKTIDRLENTVNSAEQFSEHLKYNLKEAMRITNTRDLHGETVRFKLVSGASKLIIENDTLIPISYFEEKVEEKITVIMDKEKLKTDLENGMQIEGARLERVNSLRSYSPLKFTKGE